MRADAARNVELKERFPSIDNPLFAIDFAVNDCDGDTDAVEFLTTWQEGNWSEIERSWNAFLERVR